ncbi:hypothetical protein C8R46DRAFT_1213796 [Mycena filopes]|nr:hypothetical protein C8R46DRAFT_1213796 [Mycena filopes]
MRPPWSQSPYSFLAPFSLLIHIQSALQPLRMRASSPTPSLRTVRPQAPLAPIHTTRRSRALESTILLDAQRHDSCGPSFLPSVRFSSLWGAGHDRPSLSFTLPPLLIVSRRRPQHGYGSLLDAGICPNARLLRGGISLKVAAFRAVCVMSSPAAPQRLYPLVPSSMHLHHSCHPLHTLLSRPPSVSRHCPLVYDAPASISRPPGRRHHPPLIESPHIDGTESCAPFAANVLRRVTGSATSLPWTHACNVFPFRPPRYGVLRRLN